MEQDSPKTIAIDGPAASGKSTVGQLVAARLHFLYFDTGAMYRALTFLALEAGRPVGDGEALGALAEATPIEIVPPTAEQRDGRQYTVCVQGQDITWAIRHHLVDAHVSEVAAHALVRRALGRQQRRIGLRGKVVMVGRDIGTVVLPEAPVKIYLDASVEERARRRFDEAQRRGEGLPFDTLLAAMQERDRYDSSRPHAPLRAAPDALRINSSGVPVADVVETIVAAARRAFGEMA